MDFVITIDGVPGRFHAKSAREAAKKVRAFKMIGHQARVHRAEDGVWSLAALDAQAALDNLAKADPRA